MVVVLTERNREQPAADHQVVINGVGDVPKVQGNRRAF